MFTKYIKTEGFKYFHPTSLFVFNWKHLIQVNVKEDLWKCMHDKFDPFKYINKELFALF